MKKYSKLILIIFVIVALFLLAFFGTGTSKYKSITFDEYNTLKGKNVVYVGDENNVMDQLKSINIDNDYTLSFLDYSKLSKAEKKKVKQETIEIIKDGKKKGTYKFNAFNLERGEKTSKLKQVTAKEYVKLVSEEGLHFMFVGSETCGHCINYKETIKKLYKNYKADFYYVDLSSLDEKGYNEVISTDEYFQSQDWGTPTTVIYYNGEKLDVISGEVDVDTLIDTLNNNIGIKVFLKNNKVI